MNTDEMWQIKSSSSANTEQLGHEIGSRLRGGEVMELASDLGGGKTTFVRGLAAGIGSSDTVSSPSFTISQVYEGFRQDHSTVQSLWLHHYDFYRLPDAGLMQQELAEVLEDSHAIVVVEWAGVVDNVLPAERVTMTIVARSDNERDFAITLPAKYSYLKGAN